MRAEWNLAQQDQKKISWWHILAVGWMRGDREGRIDGIWGSGLLCKMLRRVREEGLKGGYGLDLGWIGGVYIHSMQKKMKGTMRCRLLLFVIHCLLAPLPLCSGINGELNSSLLPSWSRN